MVIQRPIAAGINVVGDDPKIPPKAPPNFSIPIDTNEATSPAKNPDNKAEGMTSVSIFCVVVGKIENPGRRGLKRFDQR